MKDRDLLYISHAHWDWIKQRPQYIAEALSGTYRVTYYQARVYRAQSLKRNAIQGLKVRSLPRIPTFNDRIKGIVKLNDAIARFLIARAIKTSSNSIVWLSSPMGYGWVPQSYEGPLVYDCMDDYGAFGDEVSRLAVDNLERDLVRRSDLILVSSEQLAKKMKSLGVEDKNLLLVRNAFNGEILEESVSSGLKCSDGVFRACYFGTIGSWFDFEAIKDSLSKFPWLRYRIIGPIDGETVPLEDARIEYTGAVPHESLFEYVEDCDCFVMPFKLNDVVLSVDPVKLYEYINMGKDIVCVRYPEVERFGAFVEFYDGTDSYCDVLAKVMSRTARKYSVSQRLQFLSENSWACRVRPVLRALEELK